MSGIAVCRLCLATDVNMQNISNPRVQEVFEKLTSKKLPEKERPDIMCYLCYSLLWRCSKILSLFRKTENVFDQLSNSGIKISYKTVSLLKRRNIINLRITPVNHVEIAPTISQQHRRTDNIQNIIIKKEPMDEPIEVKLEPVELDMECDVVLQDETTTPSQSPSAVTQNSIRFMVDMDGFLCREMDNIMYEDSYEESDDSTKDSTWDVTTQDSKKEGRKSRKHGTEIKENTKIQSDTTFKEYSCKIGDKQFERKRYLRHHTAQHEANKIFGTFACSECTKSFTIKSNMRRHYQIAHTDNKKYSCDLCNKMFNRSDHLQHHMRSHNKGQHQVTTQSNSCNICNMTFTSSSNVQQHINSIHLNKRPFVCEHCNKAFSRKGNLQEHYRTHTGDKPYKCRKCDLSFAQLSNFKAHSKMHPD